jgi:SgrR family transcriptional regulator
MEGPVMRLAHDYLQLRKAFPHMAEGESFPVMMADLARALFCTSRNAKLILTKMQGQNWVAFTSGRGRGHASTLTFLADKERILMQEAQTLAQAGEMEAAFHVIKEYGEGTYARERFLDWLSRYFGYQVEEQPDRTREILKLPIFRPINTLDPAEVFFAFDAHLIKQIFSTLVDVDDEKGEIVPGLAHHWKANDEATEWIFYLRKGVLFHHGRELTANDVRFSFARLQRKGCPQNWLVHGIASMDVLSRYALRIRLNQPNHLFLLYLSFPPASIVPEEIYAGKETNPILPVGSGPFRVAERKSFKCVLEAFDQHFQGRALIDCVEIIRVPETEEAIQTNPDANLLLVKTGEADLQSVCGWSEAGELGGCSVMCVNLRKDGVLQDIRLRQALYHLINRQRMVEELGEPRLYPAGSFRYRDGHPHTDTAWKLDQALRWLEESGYQGEPIQLYTFARHAPDAWWLQREYQTYGIRLEVNIVAWSDLLNREILDKADLVLIEAVLSEGIIRMIEYYQSDNSPIRSHLNDSLVTYVDGRIGELLAEDTEEGRERKLAMIEQRLREEYALIYLAFKAVYAVSHPSLQGVRVNRRGWVDFKEIWFEPSYLRS